MPGPQLDGQVLGEVDRGRFGGRVGVRGVGPEGADADAGHARGDDDATGVLHAGAGPEEGLELLDGVEDALDVEVHDLLEGGVGVAFEGFAPGGAGVGEEDVDVRGGLGDLAGEPADFAGLGEVGGDGDGGGVGGFGGEGVEGGGGGGAGRGFS